MYYSAIYKTQYNHDMNVLKYHVFFFANTKQFLVLAKHYEVLSFFDTSLVPFHQTRTKPNMLDKEQQHPKQPCFIRII